MWNITSLFALLIVAQATELQDFYGDWIEVAFYPTSTYAPVCIRFNFAKSPDNVQCSYDDGKNSTLLRVYMMKDNGDLIDSHQMTMRVVDTSAEVTPALNIGLKCGDKEVDEKDRAVARMVNENYFVMYTYLSEHSRTTVEQNSALLFGRNVVPAEKLYNDMMSIEDLKNRRGAQMCGTENYGGFKNTEN